jgi:N-acetylneuraminic acid mutarotase
MTRSLRLACCFLLLALASGSALAQGSAPAPPAQPAEPEQGIISTIAGGGLPNNIPAANAGLGAVVPVVTDNAGNFYFAIGSPTYAVFKVDATGTITPVAGTGTGGYSGDGGPATAAEIECTSGLALDANENLYLADSCNERVRRVDASTGIITTVAGNGTYGSSGDGGPATSASLAGPYSVALDASGNILIGDIGSVRRVDAGTGYISTVAGNGSLGHGTDGVAATSTNLGYVYALTLDGTGNIFFTDYWSVETGEYCSQYYYNDFGQGYCGSYYYTYNYYSRVRRIDARSQIVTTVAGGGADPNGCSLPLGDGGQAINAALCNPEGLAFDSAGNLYISDSDHDRIRKVDSNGTISTFVGNGSYGFAGDGSLAVNASLEGPWGIAIDSSGNLYVADLGNYRVRRVDASSGDINTVAGNGTLTTNGVIATESDLFDARSSVMDSSGNLFIADSQNRTIRRVDATSGLISDYAGTGSSGYSADGTSATSANLNCPTSVALDSAQNVYFADACNEIVQKIDRSSGLISVIAGTPDYSGYNGDGIAATSSFLQCPYGIAFDSSDNLYIADTCNQRIRKVDHASGLISTVAGSGSQGFSGDGAQATSADLNYPYDVAVDGSKNLFIADYDNQRIRRVDATAGVITTIAGGGSDTSSNGIAATSAQLSCPEGVALDPAGDVFLSDECTETVRKVDSSGNISTIAGTINTYGFSGDGGTATSAVLAGPWGIFVSAAGDLYIADANNNRIRKVTGVATSTQAATLIQVTAPSVTYGASANVTVSITSVAGTVTGSVSLTLDGGTAQTISLASGTAIYTFNGLTAGSHSLSASYAGEGNFAASTATSTLIVNQATATVILGNLSQSYTGSPAETVTATTNPLGLAVNITYSGWPTPPTRVGSYAIVATVNDPNYQGSASGTLVVAPVAPIIVWPNPAPISAGTALSATQLDASAVDLGTFVYTPAASTVLPVGNGQTLSVTFIPTDMTDYSSAVASVLINVTPANLYVVANDKTRAYSDANPAFDASYLGFLNGDTASSLSGTLSCTTTATSSSPAGTYGIGCSGLSSSSYNVVYVNGQLTITNPLQSIAVNPANPTMQVGSAQQVTALGTFQQGARNLGSNGGNWTTSSATMPTGLTDAASAELNGQLYVVGGVTGGNVANNSVQTYDPISAQWATTINGSAIAPVPTARTDARAAVLGGQLYVVGGVNSKHKTVGTLEVYDPVANSWTTGPSMPTPRFDMAVGVINGKLYVAGGEAGGGPVGTLEVYDPAMGVWTQKSPMITARTAAAAGVINGLLYVAGGATAGGPVATLEAYDPMADSWGSLASMGTAQAYGGGAVLNGQLYVVSGIDSNSNPTQMVQAYNPAANTWLSDTFNYSFTGTGVSASGTFATTPQSGGQYLITGITGSQNGNPMVLLPTSAETRGCADNLISASAPYIDTCGVVFSSGGVNSGLYFANNTVFDCGPIGEGLCQATPTAQDVPVAFTAYGPDSTFFNFNFSASGTYTKSGGFVSGDPQISATGAFIGTLQPDGSYLITGITGTLNGAPITLLSPASFNTNDNLLFPAQDSPLGAYFDNNGIAFSAGGQNYSLWEAAFSPQYFIEVNQSSCNVGGGGCAATPLGPGIVAPSTPFSIMPGGSTTPPAPIAANVYDNTPVAIGGLLYVAGGGPGDTASSTLQVFMPDETAWTSSTPATAIISASGNLTAVSSGTSQVTAGSSAFAVSGSTQVTVIQSTAVLSNLTASQTIPYGTASINLSGTVSAVGGVYPQPGETITVTINSSSSTAAIGNGGTFTTSFDTHAIPASGMPYTITYNYSGDAALAPSTDTSTSLTVNQMAPVISWATSAAINYGTALSGTQLDATASVPGNFAYSPGIGAIPTAGNQTLSVTFTPTDTTDYATGTASVTITVNKAVPTVTWTTPGAMTYGTPLSGTQLDAAASVPGNFVYFPAAGAVLNTGFTNVSVTFTPTDITDYTVATDSVIVVVNKATPTVTFIGAPASAGYKSVFNVAATTNASSAVTIIATGACTNVGYAVTMTGGTGTCSLVANWAADSNYLAASAGQSTIATKIAAVVTFTGAPATAPYLSTFPVATTTTASTSAILAANGSCSIGGMTVALTKSSGLCSLTATWAADNNYLGASAAQSTTATKAVPVITWTTPAAITYGTALSGTQLNSTASVAGTFVYSPAKGTVLGAGSQTLSVTFTPGAANAANYTTATGSVTLQVNQDTLNINWPKPAAMIYGIALSNTQLDAKAVDPGGLTPPGTFVYTPAAGTVLGAGNQTLSATFTPNDTTDFAAVTATVTVTVNKATPTVTWIPPAAIVYETALSSTQQNATASVPGTFVYSPTAGTVLAGGTHTLSVTFTPTDATDYATATGSVTLQVNPGSPILTWGTPAAITFGTALSGTQLDATSSAGGTFLYSPAKSTILMAGVHTLSVTFTPNNLSNYTVAIASVTLQVNPAAPKITWAKPAAITYGTALGGSQLDATASVPGTLTYSPLAGAILPAGDETLSVNFTPTDTIDYVAATNTVTFVVNQAASTTTINSHLPSPSKVSQAVTVSFSVAGSSVPTGSVTVTASTGESCNGLLIAGAGTCSLTFNTLGSRTLSASYGGDNNFKTSSSVKVSQVVQP